MPREQEPTTAAPLLPSLSLAVALILSPAVRALGAPATLEWDAPTVNTDGTPLDPLSGYRLFSSSASFRRDGVWVSTTLASADAAVQSTLLPASATEAVVELPVGSTLYFRLTAVGPSGGQSWFNLDAGGADEEAALFAAPAASTAVPPPPPPAPAPGTQPVAWTSLVNATAVGGTLQKSAGCDGCHDAGGASSQKLLTGDGYFEFTVGEAGTRWLAGLSSGSGADPVARLDVAVRLNGAGYADVLENGVYKGGDTPYAVGDVFRLSVSAGQVKVMKNGAVSYTSARTPTYPLALEAVLASAGATVRDAAVAASTAVPPAPAPAPAPGGQAVGWTGLVNATVAGTTLRKSSGCDGCWDAGGVSSQRLLSGDGSFDFTVGELGTQLLAGLSAGSGGDPVTRLDFAVRLNGGGSADVLENGVYKGGDTPYAAGDVFRLEVSGGQVRVLKNGVPRYTSARAPAYPLALEAALASSGATVRDAAVAGASVGSAPPPPAPAPPPPAPEPAPTGQACGEAPPAAYAYPNPAVQQDPVIRACMGILESLDITIRDRAGKVVHRAALGGTPSGAVGGDPFYEYAWRGTIASGVYVASLRGRRPDGTVVNEKARFAVVR